MAPGIQSRITTGLRGGTGVTGERMVSLLMLLCTLGWSGLWMMRWVRGAPALSHHHHYNKHGVFEEHHELESHQGFGHEQARKRTHARTDQHHIGRRPCLHDRHVSHGLRALGGGTACPWRSCMWVRMHACSMAHPRRGPQ